jgi:hypothetical protein
VEEGLALRHLGELGLLLEKEEEEDKGMRLFQGSEAGGLWYAKVVYRRALLGLGSEDFRW